MQDTLVDQGTHKTRGHSTATFHVATARSDGDQASILSGRMQMNAAPVQIKDVPISAVYIGHEMS